MYYLSWMGHAVRVHVLVLGEVFVLKIFPIELIFLWSMERVWLVL